jgi:hypothetical protein
MKYTLLHVCLLFQRVRIYVLKIDYNLHLGNREQIGSDYSLNILSLFPLSYNDDLL